MRSDTPTQISRYAITEYRRHPAAAARQAGRPRALRRTPRATAASSTGRKRSATSAAAPCGGSRFARRLRCWTHWWAARAEPVAELSTRKPGSGIELPSSEVVKIGDESQFATTARPGHQRAWFRAGERLGLLRREGQYARLFQPTLIRPPVLVAGLTNPCDKVASPHSEAYSPIKNPACRPAGSGRAPGRNGRCCSRRRPFRGAAPRLRGGRARSAGPRSTAS